MDRVFIEPEKLRLVWDFVRPGLLECKQASNEPWIPEDIYADCYAGRSMLWLVVEDKPVGFGVFQPNQDTMHVWCGWGKFLMDEGFEHVRAIAKAGGASKITFDSNRRGWDRVAKKYGFRPRKWIAEV